MKFPDNSLLVQLLEGTTRPRTSGAADAVPVPPGPMPLFELLDEEVRTPHGTDEAFLKKLQKSSLVLIFVWAQPPEHVTFLSLEKNQKGTIFSRRASRANIQI